MLSSSHGRRERERERERELCCTAAMGGREGEGEGEGERERAVLHSSHVVSLSWWLLFFNLRVCVESGGAREHGRVAVCGASFQKTAGYPGMLAPHFTLSYVYIHTCTCRPVMLALHFTLSYVYIHVRVVYLTVCIHVVQDFFFPSLPCVCVCLSVCLSVCVHMCTCSCHLQAEEPTLARPLE